MTFPLVSAIIPAHNGERYLAEAIESVLAQNYPSVELIVVDDGSTDSSIEIARAFSQVRLVNQTNAGVSAARNQGVRHSSGSILAFLDQDDQWLPHKLDRQVGLLIKNPRLDYTLGWQQIEIEAGTPEPEWLRVWGGQRAHVGHFPGTLVVRRSSFECTGGFRPNTEPAEGADWFLRANECSLSKFVLPEVVLVKRIHGENQSKNCPLVRKKVLEAFRESVRRRRRAERQS